MSCFVVDFFITFGIFGVVCGVLVIFLLLIFCLCCVKFREGVAIMVCLS